jgi:hypothetical protein
MEEKKKFEKPELNVVQLKQTGMICSSPGGCSDDCDCVDDFCPPLG